jgi:hypothetical protein
MMEVDVKAGGKSFEAGAPKALFPVPAHEQFEVGKDGRFLTRAPQVQSTDSVTVNVVVGWQSALKK